MEVVTNAETGFFRPVPLGGDSLVVFRYTGERVRARADRGEAARGRERDHVPRRSAWSRSGRCSSAGRCRRRPRSRSTPDHAYQGRLPRRSRSMRLVVALSDRRGATRTARRRGCRRAFSDPIGLHNASLSGVVTPQDGSDDDERCHAPSGYKRYSLSARLRYNPASFYDLFGPTKSEPQGLRRRASAGRGPDPRPSAHDGARASGSTAGAGSSACPTRRTSRRPPGFDKLVNAAASQLADKNVRSSIGAVGSREGLVSGTRAAGVNRRALRARRRRHRGAAFPAARAGSADVGIPLPLTQLVAVAPHRRRASRRATATSRSRTSSSAASATTGSTHQDPKRYRDSGSFPGLELNEIAGTNFGKAPWSTGTCRRSASSGRDRPRFHASWLRTSLFGVRAHHEPRSRGPLRSRVANAGLQIDSVSRSSPSSRSRSRAAGRACVRTRPARPRGVDGLAQDPVTELLALLVGTLPVLLFLLALRVLDSYKLIRAPLVGEGDRGGRGGRAGVMDAQRHRHRGAAHRPGSGAPLPRAGDRGGVQGVRSIVYAIRSNRVGFLVDAAHLRLRDRRRLRVGREPLLRVDGRHVEPSALDRARLGTAMLHGTTTAVVGILSKQLVDRHHSSALVRFLPGLAIATLVHSVYNHVLRQSAARDRAAPAGRCRSCSCSWCSSAASAPPASGWAPGSTATWSGSS